MFDDQYALNGMSSWDNEGFSTSFNQSRPLQNVSSIPISPRTNYVAPYSTNNSQNPSQYRIDGRSIEQSKYQPVQTNSNNTK